MGTLLPQAWDIGPMLLPHISWGEKLFRPLVVYGFLLVAFRFSGKRELGQATLFDFLILLLISNVVQNAMIGEDNSIGGSFAGVAVLLTLSWALNKITTRSPRLRKLLEGSPTLLVHDGKVLDNAMRKESVAINDLLTAFREQGIASVSEVRFAVLELDGKISIIRTDAPIPVSREDCVVEEIRMQAPQ
ncbi:DUF421 domain-containing protein [Armatimonas sp.]|uniref:DUF421 domain-containing protein n=1 Tax=Armatimonas sp. TaxID=1872638 RepID=UPI00375358B4